MSVMPVDQLSALAAPDAATPIRVAAGGAVSGSAVASVVAALAAAATVLALQLALPDPVALVAGYVTLAATVGLCAALLAGRSSAPAIDAVAPPAALPVEPQPTAESPELEAIPVSGPPSALLVAANEGDEQATEDKERAPEIPLSNDVPSVSIATGDEAKRESRGRRAERKETKELSDADDAAWKHVGRLRVADAARLWCDLKPGHHATAEVMARASAILEAVERGELRKSDNTGILAQYRNGWHTEIDRDALQAWATANGHTPRFLAD